MLNTAKLSVLLLCLLFVSGCSSTKKQLVGKWELEPIAGMEKSGTQWEFFKSGDVSSYSGPSDSTTAGKYEWIDKSHIRITYSGSGTSEIAEVEIDGDTLTISIPEAILRYKRMP